MSRPRQVSSSNVTASAYRLPKAPGDSLQHRQPDLAIGLPVLGREQADGRRQSRPDASWAERAAAASIAVRKAARTLWSSSWRSAAIVVPPGLDDLLAQHRRVLAGLLEHRRGAVQRLHDQLGGGRAGQAQQDARLDHRLDDVEDVGRAGAADGGDRVEVLLGEPDDLAARAQQLLGLGQVRVVAVLRRG